VKITVDIDGAILRVAEEQARKQGKPLGRLIEEALRGSIKPADVSTPAPTGSPMEDGLENDDPFFAALEEIRASGRLSALHREVHLS
jgi:hypothetical protein